MSNKNFWDRRFRRNVVFDGLVALNEGRFEDWVDEYQTRDEVYLPGELKYVESLGRFVSEAVVRGYGFRDPLVHKRWAIRFFREFEKE